MNQPDTTPYQAKSAVLFLIFNRPDTTFEVFEQIRTAKPPRLYIAADGPRENNENDALLCEQAREVVAKVDWDCELKTLFKDENQGCRDSVSDAVTWFFDHEEEGIILEDDCLPANSFFLFCDTLLEKYRDDTRIRHITGCNFQKGNKHGDASYYFSNRIHVWGWASWRRVWKDYDKSLEKYSSEQISDTMANIYKDPLVVETWTNIFEDVKAGAINSWAYPLDFVNFFNNGLVIIPNQNLIKNIGYGPDATHTQIVDEFHERNPLQEIDEITHPVFIVPNKQADLFIIDRDFGLEERRLKERALKTRMKRWLRTVFRNAAL